MSAEPLRSGVRNPGYTNKRVTVAVVEVESDRPDEEKLAVAY